MLCFPVIEFCSRLMKTRRAEWRAGRKRGKRGPERLSKESEGGRSLLFYSCLEDMAHTRLPNPTGNGEPRGKGKTNKGSGMGGGGVVCVCARKGFGWRESVGEVSVRSSGFVCQVVFCGGGSHVSAFTEKIKSRHEYLPLSAAQ